MFISANHKSCFKFAVGRIIIYHFSRNYDFVFGLMHCFYQRLLNKKAKVIICTVDTYEMLTEQITMNHLKLLVTIFPYKNAKMCTKKHLRIFLIHETKRCHNHTTHIRN